MDWIEVAGRLDARTAAEMVEHALTQRGYDVTWTSDRHGVALRGNYSASLEHNALDLLLYALGDATVIRASRQPSAWYSSFFYTFFARGRLAGLRDSLADAMRETGILVEVTQG